MAYPYRLLMAVFAGLILLVSKPGWGSSLNEPYATSNRNPFIALFNLPTSDSAYTTKAESLTLDVIMDGSNNFSESRKRGEAVFIDGETHQLKLQLRYGLNERLELGVDIPYLSHEGGGLDSLIEGWHDIWNLPRGDRHLFPRDQLLYTYSNDNGSFHQLSRSRDGIADVSFHGAYQLVNDDHRVWTLRSAVALPTGDADLLLGSESTDVSLSLNLSDNSLLNDYQVELHAHLGVLWMSSGEVLDEIRKDVVLYGSSTLSWQARENFSVKIQLDAHSAFFHSALTELGSEAIQLVIGGAVRVNKNWVVDIAVSEDLAVDTAPDVVFHMGAKYFPR